MKSIKKITPVLIVEAIPPCLAFWKDQLHYEVVAEVPHEGTVGFVILKHGDCEVMLQTTASLAEDLPAIAGTRGPLLYAEVESLDEVEKAIGKGQVVVPRRKTPYGANEIWVREPSGNIVAFAEFGKG